MAKEPPLSIDPPRSLTPPPVRGCTAHVDERALLRNLDLARRLAGPAEVLAIVKADAYGHGAAQVVPALAQAGVRRFGVATVEEGLALRDMGIAGDVLVLGGAAWWSAPGLLFDAALTPVLSSAEELAFLDESARRRGARITAHVKVDTGMSRVGVPVHDDSAELERFASAARAAHHVVIAGACTHFANADLADGALTREQVTRFDAAVALLRARSLPIEVAHVSNSAATLELPALTAHAGLATWVRPGLMLYGVSPFGDGRHQDELSPVLSWVAPVVARKRVPAGTPVSYGSTWTAARETELAVLGVGYVDGYPRALGNRGEVLVAGMRAPIRGRVCMDLTVVDVTDVVQRHGAAACDVGAPVTLLGRDGDDEIRARDVACWAETIPYEILTRIGARVPRALVRDESRAPAEPTP